MDGVIPQRFPTEDAERLLGSLSVEQVYVGVCGPIRFPIVLDIGKDIEQYTISASLVVDSIASVKREQAITWGLAIDQIAAHDHVVSTCPYFGMELWATEYRLPAGMATLPSLARTLPRLRVVVGRCQGSELLKFPDWASIDVL
jgi:hypothetical protein